MLRKRSNKIPLISSDKVIDLLRNLMHLVLTLLLILSQSASPQEVSEPLPEAPTSDFWRSFGSWERCYYQRMVARSSEPCVCETGGQPITNLPENFLGVPSCLPTASDIPVIYGEGNGIEESDRIRRDELICACLARGGHLEETSPSPSFLEARRIRQSFSNPNPRSQRRQDQIDEQFGNSFGAALTAMNFATDDQQSRNLAAIYMPDGQSPTPEDIGLLTQILDPPNLNDETCVPPREFIFNQQFPSEPEFYADLRGEYNERDWNYEALSNFISRFETIEAAHADPAGKRAIIRMQFLKRNPTFQAMFMSRDRTRKQNLFLELKNNMPRPACTDSVCTRTSQWKAQLDEYKRQIRNFLLDGALPTIQRGLTTMREFHDRTTPRTSEDETDKSDPRRWSVFCGEFRRIARQSIVRRQVEERIDVNYADIQSDEDYQQLNRLYCTLPRSGSSGTMTFGAYRQQNCSTVSHRDCLARFVSAYPNSSDPNMDPRFNINEILKDPQAIAQTRSGSTREIVATGSTQAGRAEAMRNLQASVNSSAVVSPEASDSGQASSRGRTPASTSDRSNAAVSSVNPVVPGAEIQTPIVVPSGGVAATATQLRPELQRSDAEIRSIREDIAGITRDLRSEQAKPEPQRDQPLITDLNTRLEALNDRLTAAQRDNDRLRAEVAEAQRRPQTPVEARGGSDSDVRRGPASVSGGVSAGGAPQGAVGGGDVPQVSGAGASLSGPRQAPPVSSRNAALLSRYGVESGSVQGAIVVANPGGAIDYQNLRSQSAGSVLPISVPQDVYNLIASNDQAALSRYLDQIRAMPGNVVRLDVQVEGGSGQTIELFVLKNGNEISVVPGSGVDPARNPASTNREYRQFTLRDLQLELSQ